MSKRIIKRKRSRKKVRISNMSKDGVISIGYVKTEYGLLRIQFIGSPTASKLVLFVHGSGMRNSSSWFSCYFPSLHTLMQERKLLRSFFVVAVDCPGYAKSEGSRQFIRTYPREVITNIINVLGFRKATILGGRSQGACAVFNTCLENRSLTDKIFHIKPVFSKSKVLLIPSISKIPTTMLYDTDDPGHPISIGRLIQKRMSDCRIYPFRSSMDPNWLIENFSNILIQEMV